MPNFDLQAFTIVKNAIKLGYPFLESIATVLPYVSKIYVQEGYSDEGDDTFQVLSRFAHANPGRVLLSRFRWPHQSTGFAIGTATNRCLELAALGGASHLLSLQADELWHPDSLEQVRRVLGINPDCQAWEFEYLHLQNNLQELQPGAGYVFAVRLIRNLPHIRAHCYVWTYEGQHSTLHMELPYPIIHDNRSFFKNIPRKLRSHADNLYQDLPWYRSSAEEAESEYVGEAPEMFTRTTSPFWDKLSPLARTLLGKLEYIVDEELVTSTIPFLGKEA